MYLFHPTDPKLLTQKVDGYILESSGCPQFHGGISETSKSHTQMVFQLFFGGWALGRGTKNRQILWKDTKDNNKTCSLRSAAPPPASVLQIGCIKQEAQLLH